MIETREELDLQSMTFGSHTLTHWVCAFYSQLSQTEYFLLKKLIDLVKLAKKIYLKTDCVDELEKIFCFITN